jgi:hypothetical protein
MKRIFLRITIWFFAVFGAVAFSLLGILAYCNSHDEELRPEVQALIDRAPDQTPQGLKAFYFTIGLRAGFKDHIENNGKWLWQRGPHDKVAEQIVHREIWPDTGYVDAKTLTPDVFVKHPELREILKKYAPEIQNYIQLMEYGDITPQRVNIVSEDPGYPATKHLKGHRLLRLYLTQLLEQKKWPEVERIITNENHFHRSIIGRSSLLATMVSLIILKDNALFLTDNRSYHPGPLKKTTLESFVLPPLDEMSRVTMNQEMTLAVPFVRYIVSPNKREAEAMRKTWVDSDGLAGNWLWRTRFWTFKPNQTLNKIFEMQQESMTIQCPGGVDPTCLPTYQWANPSWPWQWLNNPIGRYMGRVLAKYQSRLKMMEKRHNEIAEQLEKLKS